MSPAAPLGRRIAALLYESMLLSAILLIVGFLLAPVVSPSSPKSPVSVPALPGRAVMLCGIFMAGAVYFGWNWSGGRRTLAMKTWHIAIETPAGHTLDSKRALLRYASAWIGPIAAVFVYAALRPDPIARHGVWLLLVCYAWAVVDRDRQFLHDRIAGTRLVQRA